MKILKVLLLSLIGLVVLLAVIGYCSPQQVHIERSIRIAAKPATVFTYLNGFRNFNAWSPWAALDPNTQYQLEGPPVGVGAKQSWSSEDPNVGSGSQEITAVKPNEQITMQLMLPDMLPSVVTQTLTPDGDGTQVVWAMDADMGSSPVNRLFGLILEKFIGPDYEKGLASMKPLIEAHTSADFSGIALDVVQTESQPILYVSETATVTDPGTAAKIGAAYGQVTAVMQANGLKEAAPPLAITRKFDEATKVWDFDAAIVVDKADFTPPADSAVKAGKTYGGWVVRATHVGSYESMEPSYAKLIAFKTVAGLADNGNSWEQYLNDPGNTPQEQLQTHINWPVK